MPFANIPLFSICVPTYNGSAFIKDTLESLFNQSYQNYEVIICDDVSNDDTVAIIKECIKGRANIRLIENAANLGLVNNWNKCISLSKGEYVKFLFQDDHITPGALEKIAGVIKEYKPSFITSKRKFILPSADNENANVYFNVFLQKFEYELGIKQNRFVDLKEIAKLSSKYIGINYIGEPSVYIFKKSLTETIGGFNSSFQQLCDLEFALRALSNSNLFYMDEVTCEFMIHDASTTATNIRTRYFQIRYFEYINLSARILYDTKFLNLKNTFTYLQKLRVKVYLNNKIYAALHDGAVTPEEKNTLIEFIKNYPNKSYKNFGPVFFAIGKFLKFRNSKSS
jgi:glycosyltransferase involved in cell wall biosynthesis